MLPTQSKSKWKKIMKMGQIYSKVCNKNKRLQIIKWNQIKMKKKNNVYN